MAVSFSRKATAYGQLLAGSAPASVVTTAALAEIMNLVVESQKRIMVQVKNTSPNPFNAFQISIRANDSADWNVVYNSAAQFTAPSGILVAASGDLTTLAAATNGWFLLDCDGVCEVRVEAKVAVADGTTDVYVSGYGQQ